MSLEASVAINGTVVLGLERNFCGSAARSTYCVEHLSGSAAGVSLCLTALTAAAGLILKSFLCVEFLLTGGESEFFAAVFAN